MRREGGPKAYGRHDPAEWRGLAAFDLRARRMRRETPPPTLAAFTGAGDLLCAGPAHRGAEADRIGAALSEAEGRAADNLCAMSLRSLNVALSGRRPTKGQFEQA